MVISYDPVEIIFLDDNLIPYEPVEIIFLDENDPSPSYQIDNEEIINEIEDYGDAVDKCQHEQLIDDEAGKICIKCGLLIDHGLSHEKEWRYYGSDDTRHSTNPSRCHLRKNEDKNIYKDVENLGFEKEIVEIANETYQKIILSKIKRGYSRKAIIFACIFNAYKIKGMPQSPEKVAEPFKLKKKAISKGMRTFAKHMGKKVPIRYTTPVDLVPNIMKELNAGPEHTIKVNLIWNKVADCSSLLKRSNPQSTAAGLVYYYCRFIHKKINRKNFSEKVKLSEITIVKLSREIAKILGNDTIKL
jgi:transcription initiation factor TFIIIB Brf1 subunit/transcription initiation factor TFIIB